MNILISFFYSVVISGSFDVSLLACLKGLKEVIMSNRQTWVMVTCEDFNWHFWFEWLTTKKSFFFSQEAHELICFNLLQVNCDWLKIQLFKTCDLLSTMTESISVFSSFHLSLPNWYKLHDPKLSAKVI